jgi:hypothetical protein
MQNSKSQEITIGLGANDQLITPGTPMSSLSGPTQVEKMKVEFFNC